MQDHDKTAKHRVRIFDIVSYRFFVSGLLAHHQVTTLDIRKRQPLNSNETVITGDVKKLDLPDAKFDAIVSLCALEHFGLGRYGDEVDFGADETAFKEMVRVLKPGGRLIFSTTITRTSPSIVFNEHRIYSKEMIDRFCSGLTCEDERYYNPKRDGFCSLDDVTEESGVWNVYFGCWSKP